MTEPQQEVVPVGGLELCIRTDGVDEWVVWLNPQDGSPAAGVCVGVGKTKLEALEAASRTLSMAQYVAARAAGKPALEELVKAARAYLEHVGPARTWPSEAVDRKWIADLWLLENDLAAAIAALEPISA